MFNGAPRPLVGDVAGVRYGSMMGEIDRYIALKLAQTASGWSSPFPRSTSTASSRARVFLSPCPLIPARLSPASLPASHTPWM